MTEPNNIIKSIPVVISATLYRYNYIDNKIWAQIRNQIDYKELPDGRIVVSSDQILAFLLANYSSDISKIMANGASVHSKDATSVYFLHRVSSEMTGILYIILSLSCDKAFSRLVANTEEETINYDFAIVKAKIQLADIFNDGELSSLNTVFRSLGLLRDQCPYFNINATELFARIDSYISDNIGRDDTGCELIAVLLDIIESALDKDNPTILIVTDYQ